MTIHVEPVESILRAFDHGKADNMDPFVATGTVHYHGTNAVLYGVHGKLSARDIFGAYKAVKDAGSDYLLAHRADGHTIPMGKLVPKGLPFEGWWYVDLRELK